MSSFRTVWDCMFSPRLIKVYGQGPPDKLYEPCTLEKWGDQVIHSLYVIWKLGVYTSPLVVGILYQRGYFEPEGLSTLTKLVTSVGVILIISFCCRGFYRSQNTTYVRFLTTLKEIENKGLTKSLRHDLNKYDFDFRSWPVEYRSENSVVSFKQAASADTPKSFLKTITLIPYKLIAYGAIHTFGIRLIYPGTIGFLQKVLEPSLIQGRARLIEICKAERVKLRTPNQNDIDAVFIDNRGTEAGNTLVICCEGNAGFYEIGIASTPIERGHSVIGWNHPGFGGSTGRPYPAQEQEAIDTVMQYALNKLGFTLDNIILFGWSIGGYSSTWAAMNYPEVKGIVIDASFDDLLPLALNYMPRWWGPIIEVAIRQYVNLNISDQLIQYPGPVSLVRRTEDEVICLRENDLSSNRGNHLLRKLMQYRYPFIFEQRQVEILKDFLAVSTSEQDRILNQYNVDEGLCLSLLQSYVSQFTKAYPSRLGEKFTEAEKNQMALFLARKHMIDFKASHCINLPAEMFRTPWDVNVESDFVFT